MHSLVIAESRLELVEGDITRQTTDAIVNAANPSLLGGGGVDGAIHRAGGPTILDACRLLGGCATGDAKITPGGRLAARYVIHAVGPIFRDGEHGEDDILERTYRRCMNIAGENRIHSVAFPSISTGAYGFPIRRAAPIALRSVAAELRANPRIGLVRFVLFSAADCDVYAGALQQLCER